MGPGILILTGMSLRDKAIGEYIAAHGARLREAAEAEIAKRRETAASIDLGALFG